MRFALSARQTLLAIGLLAFALALGGAVLAHFLGLAACPLCIVQRMLYLLLALLAGGALLARYWIVVRRILAAAMSATAASGVFVAAYQVWLQRFAPPNTTCGGDLPWWESFVYWAGERVPLLFQASGLCSDPAWKFLGLSLAEWSLAMFALLTLAALHAVRR